MFCNKCGAAMDPSSQICPSCGVAAAEAPQTLVYSSAPTTYSESKLARRLPILAILWIVYGVLQATRAVAVQAFSRVASVWWTGSDWTQWAGPWALHWIVAWSVMGAVLALIAAWGLYERLAWGRTAAIIAAIFVLPRPLFGTVLGVYTLILLLAGDAGNQYRQIAKP